MGVFWVPRGFFGVFGIPSQSLGLILPLTCGMVRWHVQSHLTPHELATHLHRQRGEQQWAYEQVLGQLMHDQKAPFTLLLAVQVRAHLWAPQLWMWIAAVICVKPEIKTKHQILGLKTLKI